MREQRAKLSRGNEVAKAMEYMLKRWTAFTRFPGRWAHLLVKQWWRSEQLGVNSSLEESRGLFAGSGPAADSALPPCTASLSRQKWNDVDPRAWLADVLTRIAGAPGPQAR